MENGKNCSDVEDRIYQVFCKKYRDIFGEDLEVEKKTFATNWLWLIWVELLAESNPKKVGTIEQIAEEVFERAITEDGEVGLFVRIG